MGLGQGTGEMSTLVRATGQFPAGTSPITGPTLHSGGLQVATLVGQQVSPDVTVGSLFEEGEGCVAVMWPPLCSEDNLKVCHPPAQGEQSRGLPSCCHPATT